MSRALQLNNGLLSKWRQAADQREAAPVSETAESLEAEVRRLRREVEILRQERDFEKTMRRRPSRGTPVSAKYACMADHAPLYPIRLMARVLGVSASGYYAAQQRPPTC